MNLIINHEYVEMHMHRVHVSNCQILTAQSMGVHFYQNSFNHLQKSTKLDLFFSQKFDAIMTLKQLKFSFLSSHWIDLDARLI